MPRNALGQAIATIVGNPFSVDAPRWQRAVDALLDRTEERIHAKLADSLDEASLPRLVLAVGHMQARNHPNEPRLVLGERTLPTRVAQRLPQSRAAYRRVALAAGRAHRALCAFRGSSPAVGRLRRETWAACFGDSLEHALALERVIRDHDVLVLGETGTGKELVAHAIQEATLGPSDGGPPPRSALNAAAIPETLIESELFGHIRGAFTGATEARTGRIRSASGGSFFLDEVGDLELHTQVKLLRVIETNEVSPLGADEGDPVDVRYVAATHRNLDELVEQGRFRRDLLERLAGNVIVIPALRERRQDIVAIGRAFVERYVPDELAGDDRVSAWLDRASRLDYAWPGNVRELQNAIRNVLLGLPDGVGRQPERGAAVAAGQGAGLPLAIATQQAPLRDVERWYIQSVVDALDENLAAAARVLEVDRSTVRRKLRP
jgi:transcriptional regulator of acetoin/glycerol metabolism